MTVITIADVGFHYPGYLRRALDGVSLSVKRGEIVLLEGPSGGGKTTLLRVLSGLAPAFHGGEAWGQVTVAGHDLRTTPAAVIAQRVGFLFQDSEMQGVMAEPLRDVAFGLQCHGFPADQIIPAARIALERVGAAHLIGRRIEHLSSGERQRVALAAVLAPQPDVLLLDEPTAQLDDDAACELTGQLRRLADDGLTIVIAEHRRDRVGHLADRTFGVSGGRLEPPPEATNYHAYQAPAEALAGPAALIADAVTVYRGTTPILRNVNFVIRQGQVVALVGPNGCGKSSLLRTVAGLDPNSDGILRTSNREISGLPAERRVPEICLVPQDPGRYLLCQTVRQELALGADRREPPSPAAAAAIAKLRLEHLLDRHPSELSVGERERVAIATALVTDPPILLLDEPTRGMDPSFRCLLAEILRERVQRGRSTIVATHDSAFVHATADVLWTIQEQRLVVGEARTCAQTKALP